MIESEDLDPPISHTIVHIPEIIHAEVKSSDTKNLPITVQSEICLRKSEIRSTPAAPKKYSEIYQVKSIVANTFLPG